MRSIRKSQRIPKGGKDAQSARVKRSPMTKAQRGQAPRDGAKAARGATLFLRFIDVKGIVVVDDVAKWFGMSKSQLAETVGVRPDTLHRVKRVAAPKTQSRVKEMLEIVGRIADWAGGKDQAMAWYRAEPIPAFGGRTAESLVKEGKAAGYADYLDHVAVGGFA